jgi:hypothetical protein
MVTLLKLVLMEQLGKGVRLFGFGPGVLISKIRKDHFSASFVCINRNIKQIMILQPLKGLSKFCYV